MALPSFDDFPDMDTGMKGPGPVGETIPRDFDGEAPRITSTTLPAVEEESTAAPEAPAPEEPRRPSENLQRRLDKLVRQRQEAREERDALETERDLMKNKVTELEGRLRELEGSRSFHHAPTQYTEPGADASYDGLAGAPAGGVGDRGPAQNDMRAIQEFIREEIRNGVRPIAEYVDQARGRDQQQSARAKVLEAQTESLKGAMEEFPALSDPTSDLYQITNRLLTESPQLANDPNGPYAAALMARGLLAEEARAGEAVTRKKQQAGVVNRPAEGSPSAAGGDLPSEYKAGLQSLLMNNGFEGWRKARGAQLRAQYGNDMAGLFPKE